MHYVRLLVENDPSEVNRVSSSEGTPLEAAAFGGHKDIFDYLLSKGANPVACHRRSALHVAADIEIAQALIELGVPVDIAGSGGETPLMTQASRGNTAVVEFLLANEADPTIRAGQSVLHLASNAEIIRLLVEASAPVDTTGQNGETPLMAAPAMSKKFSTRRALSMP